MCLLNFQIMNKDWNSFLTKVVIPRIKDDMTLDVTFKASLHKLLVYKSGSFFKSHRDSEKEDGMFGTLVIQLPSRYEGGELVVRHNGKTESIDFSTKADPQNEFFVYYTAFYCDCEHEIMPVTSGYRVCLIYNLITTNRNKNSTVPSVEKISEHSTEMEKFNELLMQWPEPQKLVYCLTHKYSEKNLSFDKLKTTDKLVAKFLKNVAQDCSLEIMMGTLDKELTGTINYMNERLDSSDDETCQKGYAISSLKSLNGKDVSMFDSLSVNFKREVVQEDCFDNIKAFSSQKSDTGNEGIEVEYSYRCAAIIIFRTEDILPVLKRGKKDRKVIEDMFLKLFDECNNKKSKTDQKTKNKLFNWAKEVAALKSSYFQAANPRIYEAIASFESVELFQIYLKHKDLTDDFIPVVVGLCEKFGWSKFSTELCAMLDTLHNHYKAIEYYRMLIGNEIDAKNADKLKVLHDIMKGFLKSPYIVHDRIVSYWLIAQKIQFNIAEFSKAKSIDLMVPVLIKLAQEHSSIMDGIWLEVAEYFMTKLEECTDKKIAPPTWCRVVKLQCSCRDCLVLSDYFGKETVSSADLKVTGARQEHLMQTVMAIPNWHNFFRVLRTSNLLTVRKYKKVNEDEYQKQQSLIQLLVKLRSCMPIKDEKEFKYSVKSESSV